MSPPSLPHLFVSSTSSSSSSSSWIPCAYNIDEEPQAPISGNGVWENYQERCDATDDIEDDGALEERTGFFSQESDDSDPELKRVQEQHRPLSIKRRKMSVDELESIGGEGHRSSPETERLRQRTQLSFGDGASSPSHLTAERRLSSSRPSSWPARKRRSLLPEPDSDHEDHQHQQQHETSQHRAQHQQHQSASTVDSEQPCSLDTSSLSLLSATSALVSEGADLNIDLDRHEPVTSVPSPPPNPIESTDSQDPTFSVSLLENLSPQHPIQPPPAIKPLKRSFEDAIELTSPLGNDPALDHSGWFESNKRRKVHHFPMRWTSTLSPSPYVKLCSMRDFWDVMKTRVDLSWLDLWTVLNASSRSTVINWRKWRKNSGCTAKSEMAQQQTKTVSNDRHSSSDQEVPISVAETYQRKQQCPQRTIADFRTRKIVMQHPSAGLLLKGLWEEEEKIRRQRQMIPDGVHKPMRSKILNRKPLPRIGALRIPARSMLKESDTLFQRPLSPSSLSSSLSDSSSSSWMSPPTSPELELKDQTLGTSQAEYDELARRKSGTATAVPAHALSEGYDLADYKPWKDGTILPHQGSIPGLNQLRRSTMMEPWPAEESRARDECTRMLHRMREQLNVVINLQIHLRSLVRSSAASGYSTAMKDTTESSTETAMEPMAPPPPMPTSSQMSFLLSIRHPGQVSIELLRALYGPRFLQTSAFRSIEQLLWGPHLHVHRERPYYHEEHQQHQVQRSSHMMDQDAQYSSPSSENTRGYRRQSTEYDYHQSDGEYHNYDIGAGQDVNNKYAYDHDLHHEQEHVVEEHSDSDESQQEHLDPHHYSHKRRQQHEFVQEDLSDNSSRFFSKGFSESSVTVIPGDKACEDTIRDLEVGYSAQF
ncbi:hypothetical protein BGZ83_002213 [Gryganskiella cystojenkinii]|nr:hypothetical protein BGZ83_002213 [Gryganskiella cystojenkinii]